MDILTLAPYLPLSERATVGPWQLHPFGHFDAAEVLGPRMAPAASRLVEAYAQPRGGGAVLGAVAVLNGEKPDDAAAVLLARSLLVGVVAENPLMAVSEEDQPNAGWQIATAENAEVFEHVLGDGHGYSVGNGKLARVTDIRYAPGDEALPSVAPPIELPRPMLRVSDHELADATYRVLSVGDTGC